MDVNPLVFETSASTNSAIEAFFLIHLVYLPIHYRDRIEAFSLEIGLQI
jgi:hypothetical protein